MDCGKFELKRNKWGFYQAEPVPAQEELNRYYQETYYQHSPGDIYCKQYSPEELAYTKGRMEEKLYCIQKFIRGGTTLTFGHWLRRRFCSFFFS